MKTTLLTLFMISLITGACNTKEKEKEPEKRNKTTEEHTDDVISLKEMQEKTLSQIAGLWKLYKKIDENNVTETVTKNEYLNIKTDHTFEEYGEKGQWILSYGLIDSSESRMGTMFTKIFRPNTNNPMVMTYMIGTKEENGTTYLITFDLDNVRQRFYIRQQ